MADSVERKKKDTIAQQANVLAASRAKLHKVAQQHFDKLPALVQKEVTACNDSLKKLQKKFQEGEAKRQEQMRSLGL